MMLSDLMEQLVMQGILVCDNNDVELCTSDDRQITGFAVRDGVVYFSDTDPE